MKTPKISSNMSAEKMFQFICAAHKKMEDARCLTPTEIKKESAKTKRLIRKLLPQAETLLRQVFSESKTIRDYVQTVAYTQNIINPADVSRRVISLHSRRKQYRALFSIPVTNLLEVMIAAKGPEIRFWKEADLYLMVPNNIEIMSDRDVRFFYKYCIDFLNDFQKKSNIVNFFAKQILETD